MMMIEVHLNIVFIQAYHAHTRFLFRHDSITVLFCLLEMYTQKKHQLCSVCPLQFMIFIIVVVSTSQRNPQLQKWFSRQVKLVYLAPTCVYIL